MNLAIFTLLFPFWSVFAPHFEPHLYAQVTEVSDGDSIKVVLNHKKYELRLLGIDAPEKNQLCLKEKISIDLAKPWLEKNILGKRVRIDLQGVDIYKRHLAYIWLEQRFINLELVKRGLVFLYPYPKYPTKKVRDEFLASYINSSEKRLGIHRCSKILNPYHFRKKFLRGSIKNKKSDNKA